jgi:hypothetical protein
MQRCFGIVSFIIFLGACNNSYSQKNNPGFTAFKNNYFGRSFEPVFNFSNKTYLTKKDRTFEIIAPSLFHKKPIFCRMEDKFCDRFNVWLQLRAGSDNDYRRLAFPENIEKTNRSKLIE